MLSRCRSISRCAIDAASTPPRFAATSPLFDIEAVTICHARAAGRGADAAPVRMLCGAASRLSSQTRRLLHTVLPRHTAFCCFTAFEIDLRVGSIFSQREVAITQRQMRCRRMSAAAYASR